LILSVRPSLIPQSTILASVRGAYNAVWVRGEFGADTFYYGRGAGAHPTGVAVVSDLMRVAREMRQASADRVSPFAHAQFADYKAVPVTVHESAYYLRFRVEDKPGIIAQLATALAAENISIDAVLQLPNANWRDLPFVITVEPAKEAAIRAAMARMVEMKFFVEPPLAMPIEKAL
jgi:homoserine dehydrogenase